MTAGWTAAESIALFQSQSNSRIIYVLSRCTCYTYCNFCLLQYYLTCACMLASTYSARVSSYDLLSSIIIQAVLYCAWVDAWYV